MPLNNPLIPLLILSPDVPEPFTAALNVFVAEEQALDGPEDLTGKTSAQSGFYTHRGLDGRTSTIRPGVLTPDIPSPGRVLENMDGPKGSPEEDEKIFFEQLNSTYSSLRSGFNAYLRFIREGSA